MFYLGNVCRVFLTKGRSYILSRPARKKLQLVLDLTAIMFKGIWLSLSCYILRVSSDL